MYVDLEKLQEACKGGSDRLVALAEEWDEHRLPLVEELRKKEELQIKVSFSDFSNLS